MSTQIRTVADEQIKELSKKDFFYWQSIDRRNVFRNLRRTLGRLGVNLWIPGNLVAYSHEYCNKYGDSSIEQMKTQPLGWTTPE